MTVRSYGFKRRAWQVAAFTLSGALLAAGLVAAPTTAAGDTVDAVGAPDPGPVVHGKDAGPLEPSPIKETPVPERGPAELPSGGAELVDVASAGARSPETTVVGGLPVGVAHHGGPRLDEVDVEVVTQDAGVRDGSADVVVALTAPAEGRTANAATARTGESEDDGEASLVDLAVDYSGFSGLHGGAWDQRLTLVQLPACAAETPEKAKCQVGEPVAASNRTAEDTLLAEGVRVPADGSPVVLALAADVSSESGNFGATPLAPSNTWSTDLRSGSFSWSYPITVPDVPGSFVPELGLSYSSGGVDGSTSTTNNQGSLVGDGFDLWPGFIERKYKSCALDDVKNAAGRAIGDQCWDYDNAFISFNGAAGELVPAGAANTWKLQNDDGTKIEQLTDSARANGDNDNEYWKVTKPNGTQYFFGYHRLPGWATGDPVTNSTWTVPVVGSKTGEPCNTATGKICSQAWRWNLDYALDVAGNKITYHYAKESNYYGKLGDPAVATQYTRGGTLERIDYGLRGTDLVGTGAAQPLGRVSFTYGERCLSDGSGQCTNIATLPNGWHDVPWDLNCVSGGTCDNGRTSPSFWTRNRMTGIKAQVYVSSAWKDVDSWALTHEWGTSSSAYQLLLKSIRRTGHTGPTGAASASTPPVTLSYMPMQNRMDRDGDGLDPFFKMRLSTVVDEVGGQVNVAYSATACNPLDDLPVPQSNTTRCFPTKRKPGPELEPVIDWFNKYVVESVQTVDRTGQAVATTTAYKYLGDAAWHWDESTGMIPAKEKTWSDWRGYEQVRVTVGEFGKPASQTDHWFLRGMHGDRADGSGGTKSKSVTLDEGEGDTITDQPYWAGFAYKTATYTGAGGDVVSKTVNRPRWNQTAVSTRDWGTIRAGHSGTSRTTGFQSLDDGGAPWRTTQTDTSYDPDYGRVTQVSDQGDTSISTDDLCSTTTYATNTGDNILGLQARHQTWSAGCGATPTAAQMINDVRYAYDGQNYGVAPTQGRITRTADLARVDGSTRHYVETSATFDTYGRPLSLTDVSANLSAPSNGDGALTRTARSDGHTSTTAYTPTTGFATQMVETTPPATAGNAATALTTTTVLDPVRGAPTIVTDVNTKATNVTYDALGRTSKVWLPDRLTTQTPSTEFTYRMDGTNPVAVGTTVINHNGDQRTSWAIYDGLLRQIQTQQPGPTTGSKAGMIVSDVHYDARGLVSRTYNPYYTTDATGGQLFDPFPSAVVDGQVRTTYDGLGRPTLSRLMEGDGDGGAVKSATRTIYYGNKTTTVPPVGATATTTVTDARGRTTELRQHHDRASAAPTDTTGYDRTRYTYTGRDELATVVDAANNTWGYTYDQRGRQTRTVDPDAGATTTTFDDFGRLVSTTDAENQTLVNLYDGLGRKTEQREGTATGALRASWIYDTVTNAKGYLAQSIRHEGTDKYINRVLEYDNLYRAVRSVVQIPAVEGKLQGNYISVANYAVDGSLEGMGLPAAGSLPGQNVAFDLDADTGKTTGVLGPNGITSSVKYDHVGRLIGMEMRAGVGELITANYSYDYATDRLTQFTADRFSQPGIDRSETYRYDEAGNVTSLEDVSRTGTDVQCFDHDYLGRMVDAWTQTAAGCKATGQAAADAGLISGSVAQYWHEYTYDKSGSRAREILHTAPGQAATTRTYQYSASQPHTAVGVTEQIAASGSNPAVTAQETYTYDSTGQTTSRQIGGDIQNLNWNPDGRVESVENADGTGAEYIYDADGNRLIARNTTTNQAGAEVTESTLYLGHTEVTVSSVTPTVAKATRYIDVGSGHTALIDDGGKVTFVLADHHGTGQLTIDASNMAIAQRRTTPFGVERGSGSVGPDGWASSRGFVGGYDDRAVTGLVSVGAREYDPDLGRFISLDPIMDLTDPQQLHGYTYGNNNPVAVADPSGLAYEECNTGQYTCRIGGGGGVIDVTPNPDWDGDNSGGGGGGDQTDGGSADNAGDPGPATQGPTAEEIARAKAIQDKSVVDVALELGWELLKDFVGYNDFMGCLDKDVMACGMLIAGITPWGKGLKAIKVAWKIVDGAQSLYKKQKWARKVIAQIDEVANAGRTSCNSFVPGTLVLLTDGSKKPIEDIELGDEVLAADEATGETTGGRAVTALIRGEGDKTLVTISIGDSDGDVQEVVATGEHPFWVPRLQAWVDAIDLTAGDWLQTSAGTWTQVIAVDVGQRHAVVHNLTVATDHTYYVAADESAEPTLVHNADGCRLDLRYKEGWSADQRAAADHKVAALQDAADAGNLKVTTVERSGTSASARYRRSGKSVPSGSDVDHTIDLQLGGADEVSNMSPLNLSVNRSLGAQIMHQLRGVPVGTCVASVSIC
ncbi:polymorphic toxin-type HINT domain-containing protein [Promicromonospora sp. NPDC019610]|uniref:polymorphic toxin-type HINT domain-containing protein n=1 Tax=Promicromonospora sp. NPDC019610 TaxID=3364405 RepID=UPI00378DE14C